MFLILHPPPHYPNVTIKVAYHWWCTIIYNHLCLIINSTISAMRFTSLIYSTPETNTSPTNITIHFNLLLWGMARSSMNGCRLTVEELDTDRGNVHQNHQSLNEKRIYAVMLSKQTWQRPVTEEISITEADPCDRTSSLFSRFGSMWLLPTPDYNKFTERDMFCVTWGGPAV